MCMCVCGTQCGGVNSTHGVLSVCCNSALGDGSEDDKEDVAMAAMHHHHGHSKCIALEHIIRHLWVVCG